MATHSSVLARRILGTGEDRIYLIYKSLVFFGLESVELEAFLK